MQKLREFFEKNKIISNDLELSNSARNHMTKNLALNGGTINYKNLQQQKIRS